MLFSILALTFFLSSSVCDLRNACVAVNVSSSPCTVVLFINTHQSYGVMQCWVAEINGRSNARLWLAKVNNTFQHWTEDFNRFALDQIKWLFRWVRNNRRWLSTTSRNDPMIRMCRLGFSHVNYAWTRTIAPRDFDVEENSFLKCDVSPWIWPRCGNMSTLTIWNKLVGEIQIFEKASH